MSREISSAVAFTEVTLPRSLPTFSAAAARATMSRASVGGVAARAAGPDEQNKITAPTMEVGRATEANLWVISELMLADPSGRSVAVYLLPLDADQLVRCESRI